MHVFGMIHMTHRRLRTACRYQAVSARLMYVCGSSLVTCDNAGDATSRAETYLAACHVFLTKLFVTSLTLFLQALLATLPFPQDYRLAVRDRRQLLVVEVVPFPCVKTQSISSLLDLLEFSA